MPACLGRYGPGDDMRKVFVERKTHRESWKGEESVKERVALVPDQVGAPQCARQQQPRLG